MFLDIFLGRMSLVSSRHVSKIGVDFWVVLADVPLFGTMFEIGVAHDFVFLIIFHVF